MSYIVSVFGYRAKRKNRIWTQSGIIAEDKRGATIVAVDYLKADLARKKEVFDYDRIEVVVTESK